MHRSQTARGTSFSCFSCSPSSSSSSMAANSEPIDLNPRALVLVLLPLLLLCGCEAAVYKVGDSAGWTIIGNVNYAAWAVSKKFQVGDAILFQYNKQYHNVIEVSKEDYRACSAAAPVATYATGNDTIVIKGHGHHFFICGFPGHCDAGQKVDIRIPKLGASAISPASSAQPPASSVTTPSGSPVGSPVGSVAGSGVAPVPHANHAVSADRRKSGFVVAIVALAGLMMVGS